MRFAPASVAASVLAAVVALAACSSTKNGDPVTSALTTQSTSSPAGASTPPATGFPSTPVSAPATSAGTGGGTLTRTTATAALLSATEVGGGFATTPPDTSETPLPCTPNDPPLDKQIPPVVNVQADFTGSGGNALFSEQIETYADEATIAKAIAGGEKGLACATAKLGNSTATIAGPTDLTTQLQGVADKAEAWLIKSSVANAELIIAKLGTTLTAFQFTAAPSVDTSGLPDVGTVVGAGVAKVAAALK